MADNKTSSFENEVLKLIFNNTDIAKIGDTAGLQNSVTEGSLYVVLFTSDPCASDVAPTLDGSNNRFATEVTAAQYADYARVAVARNSGGWTVATSGIANTVKNTATISFPQMTSGAGCTVTHAGIAKVAIPTGGAGVVADLIIYGILNANLAVSVGVTPQFAANAITFEEK